MTDVVLVALITATATLISGPLITFFQGRSQRRERDQEVLNDQLDAVQQGLAELFEVRDQFRRAVSATQLDDDMGTGSPFELTSELFTSDLDDFKRASRRTLTTLSFRLKDIHLRRSFVLFERQWMETLESMDIANFHSSEETEGDYKTFVYGIDAEELEALITDFAGVAQKILIDT